MSVNIKKILVFLGITFTVSYLMAALFSISGGEWNSAGA